MKQGNRAQVIANEQALRTTHSDVVNKVSEPALDASTCVTQEAGGWKAHSSRAKLTHSESAV